MIQEFTGIHGVSQCRHQGDCVQFFRDGGDEVGPTGFIMFIPGALTNEQAVAVAHMYSAGIRAGRDQKAAEIRAALEGR